MWATVARATNSSFLGEGREAAGSSFASTSISVAGGCGVSEWKAASSTLKDRQTGRRRRCCQRHGAGTRRVTVALRLAAC